MTSLWLTVGAVGLITFALRLSFVVGLERIRITPLMRRALRFVPITVLMAIIVPELLVRDGALALSLGNTRLLAGFVAVGVAWVTRNVLATIAAGMVALLLLEALL